jgi:hypothetical protein
MCPQGTTRQHTGETMPPEDLSYLLETPSKEEEERVRKAVEQECIRAIIQYLEEISETMEKNSIECLNPATLRAMSEEMKKRLNQNDENN